MVTFLGGCKEKLRPDHVFEMVELPSLPSTQDAPTQTAPQPSPMPKLKVRDIPEPTLPEPEPEPQPQPKPTPKPEPPKETAPQKPTPKPEPKPTPEKVSYQDFASTHELPKEQPKPTPKKTKPVKLPQIDTSRLAKELTKGVEAISLQLPEGRSLSGSEKNELAEYGNALRAKLSKAWRKPGGVIARAEVAISVTPDGKLSARIVKSSGNALFDQSVLDAVKRISPMHAPPSGKAEVFTLGLSTRDDL